MASPFSGEKAFAVGAQKKLIKKELCLQVKFEAVIDHRRNLGGLQLFILVYLTLITKK